MRLTAALLWIAATGMAAAPAAAPAIGGDSRAVLDQYCVTCHNERLKTAGLVLDQADPSKRAERPKVWEKVVRKLRAGAMPPSARRGPTRRRTTRAGLGSKRRSIAPRRRHPNPGPAALHRLNRAEYANAIRDLLALDVDVASLLPPDDSAFGFDNNADVLGVSPVLLERYLSPPGASARSPSAIPPRSPGHRHLPRPPGSLAGRAHRRAAARDRRRHARPPHLPARRRVRHPGEAVPDEHRRRSAASSTRTARDHAGRRARLLGTVGGDADFSALYEARRPTASNAVEARLQVRVPVKAGPRGVGATFLQKTLAAGHDGGCSRSCAAPRTRTTSPGCRTSDVTVAGPFNAGRAGDTPSRRRIFVCRPAAVRPAERPCARRDSVTTLRGARTAGR